MTYNELVAAQIQKLCLSPDFATAEGLNGVLRKLAIWRSRLIDREMIKRDGVIVQSGPFKGMQFSGNATETNLAPKLLGVYETPLHDIVEEIVGSDIDSIIDIGCADGYYAVGFALRMPLADVRAFDINRHCQDRTRRVAELNGVADRVRIGAEFKGEDFAAFEGRSVLAFVDIEGAEEDLLRPDAFPALRGMSVLVECHDVFKPGLTSRLARRFAPTHDVRRIGSQVQCPTLPNWLQGASHMDQFLATWEWRKGATPWLYMRPKTVTGSQVP